MNTVEDLCVLIEENLNEHHRPAEIAAETPLLVSGLLDSLTIMRIVTQVEQRTGVTLPDTAMVAANFRTPASLWGALANVRQNQETA